MGALRDNHGGDIANLSNGMPRAETDQFLKEIEDSKRDDVSSTGDDDTRGHGRNTSSRTVSDVTERSSLLEQQPTLEGELENLDILPAQSVAGGTVLGIHNLAIVFPQFIVRLSTLIQTLPDIFF